MGPKADRKCWACPDDLNLSYHPLAPLCRLVGVLGSVVQVATLSMLHSRQYLSLRCFIAPELVGDYHSWYVLAALEQLAEELLGRGFVPAALHQDVQHVALLVDSPPQVMSLPVDLEEHFVQVPFIPWSRPMATQLVGVGLPELAAPLPHRLVADHNSPLVQEFFDIPKAQREAMVQPDGVADDFSREAEALVGHRRG